MTSRYIHSNKNSKKKFLITVLLLVIFLFSVIFFVFFGPRLSNNFQPSFQRAQAADLGDFVITVKTDNPGTSASNEFTIPILISLNYNYNVDCDDNGILETTAVSGSYTCVYPSAGTYTLVIKDNTGNNTGFPSIYFNNTGDAQKLLSIDQWGSNKWITMVNAFHGTTNVVINATDTPNLSSVDSLNDMFNGSANLVDNGGSMGLWDTSNVQYMQGVFEGATLFNEDIGSWDTSTVTNTDRMFKDATSFNQSLNGWNVTNLNSASAMFQGTTAFNQPLNGWVTSELRSTSFMFDGATAFNQPLEAWDTTFLYQLNHMFRNATSFNQPLEAWDTSAVTDVQNMFEGATAFNQPLNGWDTSSLLWFTNDTFNGASAFDQSLSTWNMSNVFDASNMFDNSGLSRANYDATLIGWSTQTLLSDVTLGALNLTYCDSETQRQSIITNYNWNIVGDILLCSVNQGICDQGPILDSQACIKISVLSGGLNLNIVEDIITYSDGNSNAISVSGSVATGATELEIEDLTGQAGYDVVTNYSNLVDINNGGNTFVYLQDSLVSPINTFFNILNSNYQTTGGPHDVNDALGSGLEFTKYESIQTISTLTSLDQNGFSSDFNVLSKASGINSGSGRIRLLQTGNIELTEFACYVTGAFANGNQKCLLADSYAGIVNFKSV